METVNQSAEGKFEWSENSSHVNFSASRFIVKTNFLCSFFVTEFSKVLSVGRLEMVFSSKDFLKEPPFSRGILSSAGKYAFVLVEKWTKCG
ncbi:MAG: hypothetical protein SOV63_03180 [Pyramidobacter porci]|uniref:hypothetical protein n=1 Tax=Pyramidobacter porci TaxID=2605789 RepID=UPI002A756EB6|nr:hypothetical protein [Pyramidobacter porci]MDY2647790.1 hypothetical protein [Pyramidobacter porci]